MNNKREGWSRHIDPSTYMCICVLYVQHKHAERTQSKIFQGHTPTVKTHAQLQDDIWTGGTTSNETEKLDYKMEREKKRGRRNGEKRRISAGRTERCRGGEQRES